MRDGRQKRAIQRSRRDFSTDGVSTRRARRGPFRCGISCESVTWRCSEELTFERPAEELICEPPNCPRHDACTVAYVCSGAVGNFDGMSIQEAKPFVLNDAASLDVSQGNRTPSDYAAM